MISEKITKEQLVEELDRWLLGDISGKNSGGAYRDITRALEAGTDLAVFILGSCFIDAMAGFYCGVTEETMKKGSGDRFKKFSKRYLPQYYGIDLGKDFYESLRSGLVHNYVSYGKYAFVTYNVALNNPRVKHLQAYSGLEGKVIVIDRNFYEELLDAYKKFRSDILKNEEIFNNAKKRLNSLKIMKVVNLPE